MDYSLTFGYVNLKVILGMAYCPPRYATAYGVRTGARTSYAVGIRTRIL